MATIKDLKKEHFLNLGFFGEFGFFIAAHLLALVLVSKLIAQPIVEPVVVTPGYNPFIFLVYFFGVSALVYLILKKFNWSGGLLRVLLYLAMIEGVYFSTSIFFENKVAFIISLVVLFIAYFFIHNIFVHNIVLVIALAGISILLTSQMSFQTAMIIAVVLAIYDWIAVYKTKHMIVMFKRMVEQKAPFAIIIPYKIADYKHSLRLVEINQRYVFLGTGDIIVPLMLFVPALLIDLHLARNIFFGSLAGLLVLYIQFLLRDERRALPGLPPLVTGALIGYILWVW